MTKHLTEEDVTSQDLLIQSADTKKIEKALKQAIRPNKMFSHMIRLDHESITGFILCVKDYPYAESLQHGYDARRMAEKLMNDTVDAKYNPPQHSDPTARKGWQVRSGKLQGHRAAFVSSVWIRRRKK